MNKILRTSLAVLVFSAASLSFSDLTKDKRWYPSQATEDDKRYKMALMREVKESVAQYRKIYGLDPISKSETSSHDGFVLEKSDFGVLDRVPPIDTALIWDGEKYTGAVSLEFEVLDVNKEAFKKGELVDILSTLKGWNEKFESYSQEEIDLDLKRTVNGAY